MRELLWLLRARHGAGRVGVAMALPPRLDAVSPATGPQSGGTVITVLGNNLDGCSAVLVAGVACTGLSRISGTQVSAITPVAPSGFTASDVTVVTPGGTATLTGGFTYTGASNALLAESGNFLTTEAGDHIALES